MYKTTRICKCCGSAFIPETGRQVFCTPACREHTKNQTKRLKNAARKIQIDKAELQAALSGKTHLSITEAALYLGVSRPTIYARIREGELTPLRVSTRTLRIPIAQLTADSNLQPRPSNGDFSILISKEDALARYTISESWLYRRLRTEGIRPRILKGKGYFPKKDLDRLFTPKPSHKPEDWYNADGPPKPNTSTTSPSAARTANSPGNRPRNTARSSPRSLRSFICPKISGDLPRVHGKNKSLFSSLFCNLIAHYFCTFAENL